MDHIESISARKYYQELQNVRAQMKPNKGSLILGILIIIIMVVADGYIFVSHGIGEASIILSGMVSFMLLVFAGMQFLSAYMYIMHASSLLKKMEKDFNDTNFTEEMVNVNIQRLTVAGQVTNNITRYEHDQHLYQIGIRKVDGKEWLVNISEANFFQIGNGKKAVFELDMVFKGNNKHGKVNEKLSRVRAVYLVGEDITEQEYLLQQEKDKTWLMNKEK